MRRKLALIGALVAAAMLLGASFYLLYRIFGISMEMGVEQPAEANRSSYPLPKKAEWVAELAGQKGENYYFSATELQIKLDLEQQLKQDQSFRVYVENIDGYKLFCINQVFKTNNIRYSFFKTEESIMLVVRAKNSDHLSRVLDKLKRYDIEYRVEKTFDKG